MTGRRVAAALAVLVALTATANVVHGVTCSYGAGGSYKVSWDGAALEVESALTGSVVWSSAADVPLVTVSGGTFSAPETSGMFDVKDPVSWSTSEMAVTRCGQSGDGSITLTGVVSTSSSSADAAAEAAVTTLTFNLTFSARTTALSFDLSVMPDASTLAAWQATGTPAADRVSLAFASQPEEVIMGMGSSYTYLNLKNRTVPVITSEQGVGRGLEPITFILNLDHGEGGNWHTTYAPVPHYVTNSNFSFHLDNTQYSVFDFSNATVTTVTVITGSDTLQVSGVLIQAASPLKLIEAYTNFSGRMPMLPDWLGGGGAVVGMEGGTAVVRQRVAQLQQAKVPVAGLWVQDWTGVRDDAFGKRLWWNWEVDEQHYYDWSGLLTELNAASIRMMTYINPYLANNVAQFKAHYRRNLFVEAAAKGYLVKNSSGDPYILYSATKTFSFGTIDVTNPEAVQWFGQVIRCNMLYDRTATCVNGSAIPANATIGAGGWMSDFGEYLPFDASIFAGDASVEHNRFPVGWASLNRQAVDASGGDIPSTARFFSRSGGMQSPGESTLMWMGDQLVTFDGYDGLASAVRGMMTYGFSGFSLAHSDIGGYTMVDTWPLKYLRTKELLLRWMECSAFSDVMFRTHPGNLPTKSWQYNSDNQTLAYFKTWATVHSALWSYRKQFVHLATLTGEPVTRHPWLHYPNDPEVYKLLDQFMVGDSIMVAPVVTKNATSVDMYLPQGSGDWLHVWTGTHLSPGWSTIQAPIGMPAVAILSSSPWAHTLRTALCRANPVCTSN